MSPGTNGAVPAEALRRHRAQLIVAFLAVAGLCAVSVLAPPSSEVALGTVARAVAVGVPVAVGLYAWTRPSWERFGKLLVATGMAMLLDTLSLSDDAVPYSVGGVADWAVEAGLIYLILCFPTGRLTARVDRALVAAAALTVMLLFLPTAPLVEHYPEPNDWVTCGSDCPRNVFMVVADEPSVIENAVVPLREALVIALFLLVIVRLVQRIRGASALLRVTLTPVLAVGIARTFVIGSAIVVRRVSPESPILDVELWLLAFSIPVMAVAFLVGLLRWWVHMGRSLRRLAASLRTRVRPEALRSALADAFDDPSLELVFPFGDRWLNGAGQMVQPPAVASGRCITELTDGERVVAAMFHDIALEHERAFVDAVTAYAVPMLENQRLASHTLLLLRELEESRARAAEGAGIERKRIERDLHDGAQQRLVAVAIRLEYAADLVGADPARGKALLRDLSSEIDIALGEVRSLGQGSSPRVLVRRGLADALAVATEDAPIPTTLHGGPLPRYSPEVESAAYFCCLEALQNVAKHAVGATRVRITVAEHDHRLQLDVHDDGAGFDVGVVPARGGLANMRDRVKDVGGDVSVESRRSRGTRVSVTIPLAAVGYP